MPALNTYTDAVVQCPGCQARMTRRETVDQENGPHIELYQCEDDECGRRAAVMYEPGGTMTDAHAKFVEDEVRRMGAFFPGDFTGSGRGRTR